MKPWEYLFDQLMVDVRDVIIVGKSLFYLLFRYDSCVTGVDCTECVSHSFEINVHISWNIVNYEFQSFQLNLFWGTEIFNFLDYRFFDSVWLVIVLKFEPRVLQALVSCYTSFWIFVQHLG